MPDDNPTISKVFRKFLSKLDGSRDAGYLTPRVLGVIVALAIIIPVISWAKSDHRPTIPLHAIVTISESTAPGVGDLRNCNPISKRFSIRIISGNGESEMTHRLSDGEKQVDGSCTFSIHIDDVIEASSYTIKLDDRMSLKNMSTRSMHERVIDDSGYRHLFVVVDW